MLLGSASQGLRTEAASLLGGDPEGGYHHIRLLPHVRGGHTQCRDLKRVLLFGEVPIHLALPPQVTCSPVTCSPEKGGRPVPL